MNTESTSLACSSSSTLPSFSEYPRLDEQRLMFTSSSGEYEETPQGVFVQRFASATVLFRDQDERSERPVFGRQAHAIGEIALERDPHALQITANVSI